MSAAFDIISRVWNRNKVQEEEVLPDGPYVVCETTSAITTHLRELKLSPLKYGGGLRIKTLCGSVPSWDTRLPVDSVRCKYCRIAAGMDAYDFERWGR